MPNAPPQSEQSKIFRRADYEVTIRKIGQAQLRLLHHKQCRTIAAKSGSLPLHLLHIAATHGVSLVTAGLPGLQLYEAVKRKEVIEERMKSMNWDIPKWRKRDALIVFGKALIMLGLSDVIDALDSGDIHGDDIDPTPTDTTDYVGSDGPVSDPQDAADRVQDFFEAVKDGAETLAGDAVLIVVDSYSEKAIDQADKFWEETRLWRRVGMYLVRNLLRFFSFYQITQFVLAIPSIVATLQTLTAGILLCTNLLATKQVFLLALVTCGFVLLWGGNADWPVQFAFLSVAMAVLLVNVLEKIARNLLAFIFLPIQVVGYCIGWCAYWVRVIILGLGSTCIGSRKQVVPVRHLNVEHHDNSDWSFRSALFFVFFRLPVLFLAAVLFTAIAAGIIFEYLGFERTPTDRPLYTLGFGASTLITTLILGNIWTVALDGRNGKNDVPHVVRAKLSLKRWLRLFLRTLNLGALVFISLVVSYALALGIARVAQWDVGDSGQGTPPDGLVSSLVFGVLIGLLYFTFPIV